MQKLNRKTKGGTKREKSGKKTAAKINWADMA